ncbi:MAG: aminotransferase class I/II-fold pyridoxal phosphate-dependent enzyme [bacterium]
MSSKLEKIILNTENTMNFQAEELNDLIKKESETVLNLLSKRGREIFFPKKGILSQSADAKGKKINATIGAAIEDDGSPMRLKSIEEKVMMDPSHIFPYGPSYGRPDIRQKWKEMLLEKNPTLSGKSISLPVVTSALTHGLSMTGYMFVNENESIIIPDLFWGNYTLIFSNAYGAKLDTFRLYENNRLDINSFKAKLSSAPPSKKIVLLNFPNNPSGYAPTGKEAAEIVSTIKNAADKGSIILVIIDDAYFGLVYEEGIETQSLFSYLCDIHEHVLAVKLDGPTKEDYVWGFRIGFITYGIKGGNQNLYSALEAKTAGAIRGSISNASNLSQSLILKSYQSQDYKKEKQSKYELLESRYQAVRDTLSTNPDYAAMFTALPFNSGYFMCIKLKDGLDADKVRQLLLHKYDTGVISIKGIMRIAFSSVSVKDIPQMFENIYKACRECA